MDWIRKTVSRFIAFIFSEAVFWPAIVSGAGIVIGWLQEYDIFILYNATIFLIVMSIFGLERFTNWQDKNRVQHKLVFNRGRIHLHFDNETNKVLSISLGIEFINNAIFPIEFNVDSIRTKLTDTATNSVYYALNREYEKRNVEVMPRGLGWFFDHSIDLTSLVEANLIAELDAEVSYYRAGGEINSMTLKKRTFVFVGKHGMSGGLDWYDV